MPDDPNLIGYCGIYCGDCHAFSGEISKLARELRKELREKEYDKFAKFISKYPQGKALQKFEECYEALGAMMAFVCEKGCRQGGGSPQCKIRLCCQERNLEGCWQCNKFEKCKNLDVLIPLHKEAHLKNLRAIQKKGKEEFIKGKREWSS